MKKVMEFQQHQIERLGETLVVSLADKFAKEKNKKLVSFGHFAPEEIFEIFPTEENIDWAIKNCLIDNKIKKIFVITSDGSSYPSAVCFANGSTGVVFNYWGDKPLQFYGKISSAPLPKPIKNWLLNKVKTRLLAGFNTYNERRNLERKLSYIS